MTEPVGHGRDLPLDSHLHTDRSPDSAVPIDVYAALAVERGITELAITDHVDFDRRDPAYEYTTFEDRERSVRDAAERWAERGVTIRFGAELTYNTSWEADLRDHVARHRYDFTIGSVHDWPDSPYAPSRVGTWAQGRPLDEIVGPYFEQVAAAARTGLFDTIGHIDVVKRYLYPHVSPADLAARPDLLEDALRALVESGTSLEVNTSGLRHTVNETYPTAETVARFRAMGGRRVTIGSDAHRSDQFGFGLDEGYRILARAEFEELTFRRGGSRVAIALPEQVPVVTTPAAGLELTVVGAGPAYTDRPGAVGAAYLVRHGSDLLLLDLGQGAFPNLAGLIEPSTLTAVAVSHLHPDHFVDLVPLRHYLRYEFDPPRRVAVIGPAGLAHRIDALHDQPGFTSAALDVADLRPGIRSVGGLSLEAVRVQHTVDSYAFRVSVGRSPGLVYSGDCGAADDLRPLIRPGDTLLAEATYGADPVEPGSNHLNAADVAGLAADTGVGRVLLTHVLMGRDRPRAIAAAEALLTVPVTIVDPGDRFDL